MNAVSVLRALGPIDLRNLGREKMLAWMMVLPVAIALVERWGTPALTGWLLDRFGFDLIPYYPVVVGYFVVLVAPTMLGVVVGFLLIDERDADTIRALQVTPLSLNEYVAYRLGIPMVLTLVLMFVTLPLAGLGRADATLVGATAVSAAALAPIFALLLVSFARNKVQAFAIAKLAGNVLLVVPLLAFFVTSRWELAFGLLPTYWPLKVYWVLEAGGGGAWAYFVVGLAYQFGVSACLMRRYARVMQR